MLGWIYRKLVDGKVVCDECRGGKSKTRDIQRQVLGLEAKNSWRRYGGIYHSGKLEKTPRADGAGILQRD